MVIATKMNLEGNKTVSPFVYGYQIDLAFVCHITDSSRTISYGLIIILKYNVLFLSQCTKT